MRRTRNRAKTALTIGTVAIGMAFGVAGFGASALADGPRGHGKGPQASYKQGPGGKAGYHGRKQYRAQKHAHKKGYRQGYKRAYKAPNHGYKKHAYKKGYKQGYKHAYKKRVYKKGGHYGHGHRHGPYYKGPAFGFFFGYPVRNFGPAPVRRGAYKYYGRQYCHPVSKIGYDAYGRRVKFGGTMCYDRYGAAYIVRGSKHIIHYY